MSTDRTETLATETLARTFSRLLRETLSAWELAAAIEANALDTSPIVCHSHDHCDANEVMLAAFAEIGITIDIFGDDDDDDSRALWGAAWDLAKVNRFYVTEAT